MSDKITNLTITPSPIDGAEFAANEGGTDYKYTRAQIVAGVVSTHSAYVTSNNAAVALKAPLASPTFTGTITATGATTNVAAPSSGSNATTKTYVDTQDGLSVLKAGSTMTGLLVLSGTPTTGLHAATKTYVDTADALSLPLAGGTMTGNIVLAGAPSSSLHPTTKTYVDTADALSLKGPSTLDCSTNPNYPASTAFDTIRVTVAGLIGGGSGPAVEVGDLVICHTTSSAGNHATVGTNFIIVNTNVLAATTSVAGRTRYATTAEVDTTDLSVTDAAVTPSGLKFFYENIYSQTNLGSATLSPAEDDAGVILVEYDAGLTTITLPDCTSLTNPESIQFRIMKITNGAPTNGILLQDSAGADVNGAATFTLAAAECEHTILAITDGTAWYAR
jgi:hypothetical protein